MRKSESTKVIVELLSKITGMSIAEARKEMKKYTPKKTTPKLTHVNRYTRATKIGRDVTCPKCNGTTIVYHFAWQALICSHCKKIIEKSEWLTKK